MFAVGGFILVLII